MSMSSVHVLLQENNESDQNARKCAQNPLNVTFPTEEDVETRHQQLKCPLSFKKTHPGDVVFGARISMFTHTASACVK